MIRNKRKKGANAPFMRKIYTQEELKGDQLFRVSLAPEYLCRHLVRVMLKKQGNCSIRAALMQSPLTRVPEFEGHAVVYRYGLETMLQDLVDLFDYQEAVKT